MLGSEPVEEDAVRDLAGKAAGPLGERGHHDPAAELVAQQLDPLAREREGALARGSDPEQEPIDRKSICPHAVDRHSVALRIWSGTTPIAERRSPRSSSAAAASRAIASIEPG